MKNGTDVAMTIDLSKCIKHVYVAERDCEPIKISDIRIECLPDKKVAEARMTVTPNTMLERDRVMMYVSLSDTLAEFQALYDSIKNEPGKDDYDHGVMNGINIAMRRLQMLTR